MSKKLTALTLAAAVGGAMSLAAMTTPAQAAKVKCYGVSKAGENDCANKQAGHSCKGLSKVSYHGMDWKIMDAKACADAKGKTAPFDGINPAKKQS